MNTNSKPPINPAVEKAGLALAVWVENNLVGYVAPALTENDGPAVRLCAFRTEPQPGWTEFFPARALPEGTYGISVRFRALATQENPKPGARAIEMNGIRFVAEIYTTFEERYLVLRVTDPEHRLIAKLVSDEEDMRPVAQSDVGDDVLYKGRAILDLASLPPARSSG